MFGDEPRFDKEVEHTHSHLIGYKKSETDSHVGPGSYFAANNEEFRWVFTVHYSHLRPLTSHVVDVIVTPIVLFRLEETNIHTRSHSHMTSSYLHLLYLCVINNLCRCGWTSATFSRRQPMSPHTRNFERNYLYVEGVLSSTGLALPGSPVERGKGTPGPGHYSPNKCDPPLSRGTVSTVHHTLCSTL